MSKKDFVNDEAVEGESKMNIALRFELHLLEIIERCNEAIRENDPYTASLELQFLYEELLDKVEKEDISGHESYQKRGETLRRAAHVWSNRKMRQSDGRFVLTWEARKKLSEMQQVMLQLCSEWKKELVLIMNKHGLLITKHKGIGEAVTG